MKKIIAFSGSNSANSINQQLVKTAAKLVNDAMVEVLDIRDYASPFFSIDLEKESGIPTIIQELREKLNEADGYMISSPEHNGSIPAYFKNMIDWLSRMDMKVFGNKPMLLMSTSPGKGGGATNLGNLQKLMPWWGGEVVSTFSLGSFHDKFKDGELGTLELKELQEKVQALESAIL